MNKITKDDELENGSEYQENQNEILKGTKEEPTKINDITNFSHEHTESLFDNAVKKEKDTTSHKKRRILFDEEWYRSLKEEEEELEFGATGLTAEEREEYGSWYNPFKSFICNVTDDLKRLIINKTWKLETHRPHGPILHDVVAAVLGGNAFARRVEIDQSLSVKISLLIDCCNMYDDAIKYIQLTVLVMLEVLFDLNEELPWSGWNFCHNPAEFEVGLLTIDDTLLVSHETSTFMEANRRKAIIYKLVKCIETGSGIKHGTLERYLTRLKRYEEETYKTHSRILFLLTDKIFDENKIKDVNRAILHEDINDVVVFPVLLNTDATGLKCDKDRLIHFAEEDLKVLPKKVMTVFLDCLCDMKTGL